MEYKELEGDVYVVLPGPRGVQEPLCDSFINTTPTIVDSKQVLPAFKSQPEAKPFPISHTESHLFQPPATFCSACLAFPVPPS